ncbi:sulfurtransferase [Maioricimonas sp. JC845]|uniref:sulfurtransferase n=1 Tax=Maioricimonas sp. JC845 TaxID=3232138 RepID=UPI003458E70F
MKLARFSLVMVTAGMLCGCPEEQPVETASEPVPSAVAETPTGPPEQPPEPPPLQEEPVAAADLLITVEQLQPQLDVTGLRILDVRGEEAYAEAHVPGAVRVEMDDWKSLALSEGGLQDADAWAERVSVLGIRRDTPVVVYSDNPTNATRIWWTLEYLGVPDVRVLDGGWAAWQEAGAPVATEPLIPAPTEFVPEFQTHRLAVKEDVQKVIETPDGAIALLDARSDGEYAGTSGRGARKGHIPGFAQVEWKEFVDEQGRFRSPDEIRAIVGDVAGEDVAGAITYCQSGGRAALNAFALELAGYGPVRNYYCGWSEWSAAQDAPIETPAEEPSLDESSEQPADESQTGE